MSYSIQRHKQKPYHRLRIREEGKQEAPSIGRKTENVTPAARLREIKEEVYKAVVPREHLEQRRATVRNGGEKDRDKKKGRIPPVNMRGVAYLAGER